MCQDKYYITDILNKTGVKLVYKNKESGKEYTLLPNDTDYPTDQYIRNSDYLTGGDLIPYSLIDLADLMIYRTGVSIHLAKSEGGDQWSDLTGQSVSSGLSDSKKLIMQVKIDGSKCKVD